LGFILVLSGVFTMRGALRVAAVGLVCLALAASGCASRFKKQEKAIEQQPINCATAEGDLRMLQHEKANLAEEVAMGVTAIYPASLVVGVVTGTEATKLKVGTGEYNRMIDKKMAAIQSECGL
jgi:hypothetical protein